MFFIPPEAHSDDVTYGWEWLSKVLDAGANPYQVTDRLNYPPLFLQLIYVVSKIAAWLHIPIFRVVQIFLILVETGVIIQLLKLIREVAPAAHVRTLVIFGMALNPVAIFQVCQQGHVDMLVALWLMLFINSLLRFNRAHDPTAWLEACLFLGLGILTKQVGLILLPMLAGGFRQVTASAKFLGSVLVLGPVTLGMGIIYVLAPAGVTAHVLKWRSCGGYFGVSGFFHVVGWDRFVDIPNMFFYGGLVLVLTLSSIFFWRWKDVGNQQTVLYSMLVMAAIPALGPGYANQYITWFWPFLVATYACYKGVWRGVLVGFTLIAACTYLVEYALTPMLGQYLLVILEHIKHSNQTELLLQPLIKMINSQKGIFMLRLPIFVAYLALLVFGVRLLWNNILHLRISRAVIVYSSLVILAFLGLSLKGIYFDSDDHLVSALKAKAEKGNANAQFQLAQHYLSGSGVSANSTNAFLWFSNAAAQGLAEAQCQLGLRYFQGEGTVRDVAASIPWFRKAAEQGNTDAQYNLGLLYENGQGVKQDLAEAAVWYQRAGEKGHALAQNNLGMICFNIRKDYGEAAQWFMKSAMQGNALAQNSMGVLYLQGQGVKADANEAIKWFQQAAQQGLAEGQNNCGLVYFEAQQFNESAQWYHKAADQGHAAAQFNLAQFYQKGICYPQDLGEAFLWYSRSTKQGYGPALLALGKMCHEGQGVKADSVEAYKWFKLAQLQGVAEAEKELNNCVTTMSGEQITAAENEVRQWRKQ